MNYRMSWMLVDENNYLSFCINDGKDQMSMKKWRTINNASTTIKFYCQVNIPTNKNMKMQHTHSQCLIIDSFNSLPPRSVGFINCATLSTWKLRRLIFVMTAEESFCSTARFY